MMKFSIVTPSFNQGQFIEQTIESVLSQKGDFEIEYFVMDAGSKDNTVEIIKKIEAKIGKGGFKGLNGGITFYWQSKKDKGQSDAINQGLKRATGDILAYINSDDSYAEGSFQMVCDALSKNKSKNWVTGYCNIVDQDNKSIRSHISKYKNFWLNRYSHKGLLMLNFISQPSTFWRASMTKQFGLFDEGLAYTMDYDYWLRICGENDPIILRSPLANFRIHNQSKGETAFLKQFNQDFEVCSKFTQNRLILLAHKFHNKMIIMLYKIIK